MSGQLRTLKKRIRTVESTRKITRAMEMVAAAKLRRFQNMMTQAKPYTDTLGNLVKQLASDKQSASHPFFEENTNPQIVLVVMTSDTGLCGSFNSNLIETARRFITTQPVSPVLIGIGKAGISALEKSGLKFHRKFIKTRTSDIENMLQALTNELQMLYLEKKLGGVYITYSQCLSPAAFKDTTEKLLPMGALPGKNPATMQNTSDYIYEPSPEKIFEKIIPAFFRAKTRMIYFEASVAEQTARMNSMHLATKNADEMSERLVLLRNKIRQAAITNELIEIVSGSRALEGK